MVLAVAEGGERVPVLATPVEHEETFFKFYVARVSAQRGTGGTESVCSRLLIVVVLVIVLVIQSRVKE